MAPATVLSTLNDLKRFFGWLALQPGFKRSVNACDIEYFNLSEKAVRAATAPANKDFPTLQMFEKVIAAMPLDSSLEKRDTINKYRMHSQKNAADALSKLRKLK